MGDLSSEHCITDLIYLSIQVHWVTCPRCKAKITDSESRGFCCGIGSAKAPDVVGMPYLPSQLEQLYTTSKELQTQSRKYNNLFSMSAVGTTGGFELLNGPCNLILSGRTFHRLMPGHDPSGPLRWFLNDASYPLNTANALKVNSDVLQQLRSILMVHNPLLNEFKRLAEQPAQKARLELSVFDTNEIAAVIVPDRNGEIHERTLVCWKHAEDKPKFIDVTSPLFLPLHYVLICPAGTPGWSPFPTIAKKKITMLQFYRQMVLRSKALHLLGRLFNEFIVDIYSGIEENRLNWIRRNQSNICKKQDLQLSNDEGRIYLPSSFIGSPRHNQKLIADALTIVSKLKNPTYFITFTCNPKWEEISTRLFPGQNASDRPDIVNMVFKAKLQKFMRKLPQYLNGRKNVYLIHVVEFQTRGLPHAHILDKMELEPATPAEIDNVICAELPTDPKLLQIVLRHMIPYTPYTPYDAIWT